MTGTIINVLAIIAGSSVGLLLKRKLPERYTRIVFQAIGLFTIFLGIKMTLSSHHIIYLIFSLVLGSITGEMLRLDKQIDRFSNFIRIKLKSDNEKFAEGFISSFLLFCMGSMTVLGAIEEGLGNEPKLLIAKSIMDGFSSIALASAMGIGVLLSAVPLLLYQGSITVFATYFHENLTELYVNEITAVGGIMLLGLGISILDIKKINIINMLPGLLYMILLIYLFVDK